MTSEAQGDFHGRTLTFREVAGFALREMVHEAGVSIPKHSHKCAHVAFVLRGALSERCERTTLECRPQSVSFLAPGVTHSDEAQNEVHCLLIDIAPQRLSRVSEALHLDDPIFLNGGMSAWLMMRLYREARQFDRASQLAVEGLALEILAEMSAPAEADF